MAEKAILLPDRSIQGLTALSLGVLMGIVKMDLGVSPRKQDIRIEMAEVANGETGDWYILPSGLNNVGVEVAPAGTAKAQATLNVTDLTDEDSDSVVGVDWDPGEVTENTQQLLRSGVAVRLVSVSGTAKGYITGVAS
jgi:hypothetical protein